MAMGAIGAMGTKARVRRGRLGAIPACAAMVMVALALAATPARAQQPAAPTTMAQLQSERRFDIPAQPLTDALVAFGRQSGIQVTVDGTLVRNVSSPAVRGTMTGWEALTRLLAGSGLTYVVADEETVAIERPGQQNDDGTLRLGPITVEGEAQESAFGPVTGYRASRSATATRTDTPILETPASIQVIPETVIKDQAITRLRDVYRNISGVQSSFTGFNVASSEEPIIRGFEDSFVYRNGFRTSGTFAPVELANVERVEVLKGPASILFGLAEPGGLLNIVTKRPVEQSFATLSQEIGSFHRYRTTIDANTPLAEDGSLLGRINLAYTSDDTFRDHDGIDRFFAAPSLTWRPGAETELILEASYSFEKHPFDHGLAFSADGEPLADVSTFLGEPDFRSEREEFHGSYFLTHDITERLTFRNSTSFQYTENRLNGFRQFDPLDPVDNTVDRTFAGETIEGAAIQSVVDLSYDFELGPSKHAVLIGLDARLEPKFGNVSSGPRSNGPFPINGIDPQYGRVGAIPNDSSVESDRETKWVGVYVQDQVSLLDDRLHLLAGGRYDYVEQFVDFNVPGFQLKSDRTDEAFTGRFGILYELTDWASPYFNVSQSFNPVSPFTVGEVEPTEGFQIEGGMKLNFFDERLTATLAGYQITKDNVPVADVANPPLSINGGELRSRGFELDIIGELAPGWQIIANYAYTDTEVLASDTLPVGGRFRNAPKHRGNLWSSYAFQPGSGLEGVGFGIGVSGASAQLGDDAGTFELDGFVVADAALWYRADLKVGGGELPIKAQFNVQNLFDKEYYANSQGVGNVFPGAPRTFVGSISVRF